MSKIRLNTELRNKLFNKIKNVFEEENTQEKEAYLQARENVNHQYELAFDLATGIVQRAYPPEDVKVLRHFKNKYGSPCDVVAKDKCFYFAHTENVDEDNKETETKSHFDFGLLGNGINYGFNVNGVVFHGGLNIGGSGYLGHKLVFRERATAA